MRALGHTGPNEQSTIRSSGYGQFIGVFVFLFDQIFGSGDKIIEHILFLKQCSGFVPCFAVFSTTTKVWNGNDSAFFEPYESCCTESRSKANVESTVSV